MLALAGTLLGCGGGGGGAAATAAAAPAVPGESTAPPDLTGVQLPDFVMPAIKGGVSRPNRKLTPGSVVTTDANTVCDTSDSSNAVSVTLQTAVMQEYGYGALPQDQHKYILDYLIPIDLGGAATEANVWPAATRGAGFYQKVQTDHILRELVCRRSLSLTAAQDALEKDWYAAWLRYVVATGAADSS